MKIAGSWSSRAAPGEVSQLATLVKLSAKLSAGKLSSKTGGLVKEEPRGQERRQEQKIDPGAVSQNTNKQIKKACRAMDDPKKNQQGKGGKRKQEKNGEGKKDENESPN